MTIPTLEAADQQQQQEQQEEQQQQFQHLAEQLENKHNNKKKKSTAYTKNKRVAGYNNRYNNNQGVSRYNNGSQQQQYYPYVYYYPPPSPYYPTAIEAASPNINITTRDDEDLEIIMHDESTIHDISSDQNKILDLKKQLEYYFSRQNLVNDTFLVSQMDSELYVPISLIANFKRVREWTTDMNVIVNTLRESSAVTVDDSGTKVKPNISLERSTVILRDVPECTEEEITEYLKEIDVPSVQSMKKDIGNLWYFTFESENDALRLFNNVKGKPFKNQMIAARMKSEPALRVQTRTAATPSSNQNINAIVDQGNEYPYTGYYYPYQNAYQNNRRNSNNTRSFNNRSPNQNYYNNNNNRQQQQQQQQQQYEYQKTSPVGGRSTRGGYKPKNYNKSTRSPTTTNEDNGTDYKLRIDTQSLENGMTSLSLQQNEDFERKHAYYQKQKQQFYRPYHQQQQQQQQQNRTYQSTNKVNNGGSTSPSNDTKRHYNKNYNHDTRNGSRNDNNESTNNPRRHSNDTRNNSGDTTRRHSNDTRSHDRNYNNEDAHETRNHKNNADKSKKKFPKRESEHKAKDTFEQWVEPLTPTHFPPLPNQQSSLSLSEPDITPNNAEAVPTRSVADIVKSGVPVQKEEKKVKPTSNDKVTEDGDEQEQAQEEEAFPSLCQTTEFRANPSSYADILNK